MITPGQKQLEALLLVKEDPGKNISSRAQGPGKKLFNHKIG